MFMSCPLIFHMDKSMVEILPDWWKINILVDIYFFCFPSDYKYRGAVKKYQSQSQLAYEDHVQEENLLKMVKTC